MIKTKLVTILTLISMTKSDDEPHSGGPLKCFSCLACDPDDSFYGRHKPCEGGTCYSEEIYTPPPRKGYPMGLIFI